MYKVHQDAELLSVKCDSPEYRYGNESVPQLNVSASVDAEDKIHISICNLNPNEDINIKCELRGTSRTKVTGTVLTAEQMNAHNTFENPEAIKPAVFNGASINENIISISMPSKSVVVLTVE